MKSNLFVVAVVREFPHDELVYLAKGESLVGGGANSHRYQRVVAANENMSF